MAVIPIPVLIPAKNPKKKVLFCPRAVSGGLELGRVPELLLLPPLDDPAAAVGQADLRAALRDDRIRVKRLPGVPRRQERLKGAQDVRAVEDQGRLR